MLIKRKSSKKLSKPSVKKESREDRFLREWKENKVKEAEEKKQIEAAAKKEYERKRNIIVPYLNKLEKQIDDKDLTNFWVFPEHKGFKKHIGNLQYMRDLISKHPAHYEGKKVAYITIFFRQNEPDDSFHRDIDTWLGVNIAGFMVKNGKLTMDKEQFGGYIVWKTDDFAITKFSLKLVENFTKIMLNKDICIPSIVGYRLEIVLNDIFKRRKVTIDKEILTPLSGIKKNGN